MIIQAPATYTPHDVLLSLSVQLCEKYLRDEGYAVPELTPLSPASKLLRRAKAQARRLGRWSSFAVPAAALLVLGLSASARSLYAQYATSVADFARTHAEKIRDDAMEIWQGQAVVASVTVTVIGIAWWKGRHAAWLPRLLGAAVEARQQASRVAAGLRIRRHSAFGRTDPSTDPAPLPALSRTRWPEACFTPWG